MNHDLTKKQNVVGYGFQSIIICIASQHGSKEQRRLALLKKNKELQSAGAICEFFRKGN